MKSGATVGLILLVTAGALVLRVPELDRRPMHTDEAVHAVKFLGLWEEGVYRYDPHEYHGPSLYYATLPLAWLSGARDAAGLQERTLRLAPVLIGVLLVAVVALARSAMGSVAALWGAMFAAFSPAMVFYSRYYIHELLLVLWAFVFLVSVWRHLESSNPLWLVAAGTALGLMYATKETFVLALAAAGGAAALTAGWIRWREGSWPRVSLSVRAAGVGVVVALGVGLVLFTSFFQNWTGPLDSVRSYGMWFGRAEGQSPHVHPWHYYLSILVGGRRGGGPFWTEGAIVLLGLVGMMGSVFGRRPAEGSRGWGVFLTCYTLLLTVAYCCIPYKTPWCVLGFLHGWILVAGLGVARLSERCGSARARLALGVVMLAATGHLGWQAWRASFPLCESQRNPYVYAQTVSSVLELVARVRGIAAAGPDGPRTVVKVMALGGDYWPLPWYLREFQHCGWYAAVPKKAEDVAAPILIASPDFAEAISDRLGTNQEALGYFGLRPHVFLQLHVEKGLWARYLAREQ